MRIWERVAYLIVIIVAGTFMYGMGMTNFTYSLTGPQANYRNVTIDTTVNITGSAPVVVGVRMQNPIILKAGTLSDIACNITIRDYNGFGDLSVVNATLFHQASSEAAADENNTHYTNASCSFAAGSGYYANYTCTFPMNYYALNGTWNCSARVNDSINLRGVGTNKTTLSAVYALNITQTLLDYGELSGNEYSGNVAINLSNIGNSRINISTFGYARTMGDNLSFVCDYGNLSVDLQRFAANESATYAEKQALSKTSQKIAGLTMGKTADASGSYNTTYWELYADPTQVVFGNCTGFLVFQAGMA